jgi:hypothetical protein
MRPVPPISCPKVTPRPVAFALFAGALLLAGLSSGATGPAAPKPGIDPAAAAKVFAEIQALCDRDKGALWGTNLYGGLLLLDENTFEVAANGPDYQNRLKAKGEVFSGTLDDSEKIVDNSIRWGGVTWTVLGWPLPEDRFQRDKVALHLSFGRVADRLGVPSGKGSNDHLDTKDGRIWLQLEWRALYKAIVSLREGQKEASKRAAEDALLFRAHRRGLFPNTAESEDASEDRDGLGEYTGVVLAVKNRNEALAYAANSLLSGPSMPSYAHLFAYLNGPAYGLLLDEQAPGWRKAFKGTNDLGDLLGAAFRTPAPADLKAAAEARMGDYGGKELAAAEDQALAKRQREAATLRARFVEGPVLDLPVARGFNYAYDPEGKVAIEGVGTVYTYARVFAEWGSLVAEKGALLPTQEGVVTGVRVPAPKDASARPVVGEGWTLTLKPGWTLAPGERKGDWVLKQTTLGTP